MRFILFMIFLLSNSLFASDYEEVPDCPTQCTGSSNYLQEVYGDMHLCYEIMHCSIQKWNEDQQQCETVAQEDRKVSIQCRDIQPLP